jgi:hypothetical protein
MSATPKADRINAVALTMQGVMAGLVDFYDDAVGAGQHNIVLIVNAGDTSQYVANTERPQAIGMMQGVLARWSLGMPDTMPGESAPGDTRAFEYLLNEFVAELKRSGTEMNTSRANLVAHAGSLVAQANRRRA